MARTSLQDIIEYVRVRIGDTGTSPTYSDDLIQSMLDAYRKRLVQSPVSNIANTAYTEHTGPTFLETDDLYDDAGAVVTATSADYINGYIVTTGHEYLFISGWEHDPDNVVADILQLKLAAGASGFVNVSTGRHSIARGQARDTFKDAIRAYRQSAKFASKGRGSVMRIYRDDFNY